MIKLGTKFYYSEESKKLGFLDEVIEYETSTKLYKIKYIDRNNNIDTYVEREEFIRNKMEKFGCKLHWKVVFSYPKRGS